MSPKSESNGNGKSWAILILIVCGLGTLSMFFAGLGYHNVDKRLCAMERKTDLTLQKTALLELYQDERLRKEKGDLPRRPSIQDIIPN